MVKAFGEVKKEDYLCYIGSADLLEIAKNEGNLRGDIKVEPGNKIILKY